MIALLVVAVAASAGAQEGAIQEAQELNKQVVQLYAEDRYSDAIPLAQRALAIREKVLGPTHPETAESLKNLALLYDSTGAYAQAEPLLQRALAIREKVLGPDHPDTAASLTNLALHYYSTGAYARAEPLLQRALAIREKVLGPAHPETADSVNNLAGLYDQTGAYAQAEPLHQRALEIREEVLGPTHPETAESLANLALHYYSTGAYARAEPLLQRALAIHEQVLGPEHPDTARSLNNLAALYREIGAYAKAEPLFQRALAIKEKVLGPEHTDTARSLTNLGLLYYSTGAYARAEPLLQRALTIHEKVLGPAHPDTAHLLNSLAGLHDATGAYAQAEPLYRRALAIREDVLGPTHPDTADSLNNLAGLYKATGAYAQAEPLYRRALAIREKALGFEHPGTAQSLNNLGVLNLIIGAYGDAEPLLQRALTIREAALGPEHPDTAQSLTNLGLLYYSTGAYAQAEPLLQRALAIHEKVLGPEHPDSAHSLNNLAGLYKATGAYAQAESLYRRALAIREEALGSEHLDTALSLTNLALLNWTTGNKAAVLPLVERAQAIREKNTAGILLSGSEVRKQAYVQQFREDAFTTVSLSLALLDRRATSLGLTSVLQAKGRVLDAMSDSVGRLRQSVRPEDHALFDELATVAQEFSNLVHQGLGRLSPDAYRQRLNELAVRQETLESEISTRSAEFRREVISPTIETVQKSLPKKAALLEWFRYEPVDPKSKEPKARWGTPRYVAYVLRHDGEPAVVDVGEAVAIERLIHDFRTGLSHPKNTYVEEVARELSDKLVKPLRTYLGNAERWLISPDGALNLVPFAALVDETGTYLGMQVDVTYLTSGRDLLRFAAGSTSRGSAVVVADPDYGKATGLVAQADSESQPSRSLDLDRGGMRFDPLPGTADEAKALKVLLNSKDEDLLTQAKATEERLKQMHGPLILHIATHGFFLQDKETPAATFGTMGFSGDQRPQPLGENPLLRSGLALAGANLRRSGEKDDGILTAAEMAQMDLRGTQLVVLSACETGIGEVQNGEGVYGLRRALVLAGAQTQVASLWKVSDDATKDLMVEYYQRLLKGEGRSAALREAQRTMINSKARSHPYYWAAFVPIGDWRPLTQGQ